MLEKKKLWCAISNTDLTEGRGRPKIVGYSTCEATAQRIGQGKGVMGSNARVRQRSFYVDDDGQVFKRIGEITEPTEEDLRKNDRNRVVEKAKELGLTDDEIKLLQKGDE